MESIILSIQHERLFDLGELIMNVSRTDVCVGQSHDIDALISTVLLSIGLDASLIILF